MPAEILEFRSGERLHWNTPKEIKVVVFRGQPSPAIATIGFGLHSDGTDNLWDVPVNELTRPAPPPRQDYGAALAQPPAPVSPSLAQRRMALAEALADYRQSGEEVERARLLADQAQIHVVRCHTKLRSFVELDEVAVIDLVKGLGSGNGHGNGSESTDQQWADQQIAQRNASLAEAAYAKVSRALSEARIKEQACQQSLYSAAAQVLGSILSREIEALGEVEQIVAERRANLKACSRYWPDVIEGPPKPVPLSRNAATIIHNNPASANDPIGYIEQIALSEQRQEPLKALFATLITGDNVDADLDT